MEEYDVTEPFLTVSERKQCVDIMKKDSSKIPTPANDKEIKTIITWLSATKKNMPVLYTFEYKDCCFQKTSETQWELLYKNNDLMYAKLLERRMK